MMLYNFNSDSCLLYYKYQWSLLTSKSISNLGEEVLICYSNHTHDPKLRTLEHFSPKRNEWDWSRLASVARVPAKWIVLVGGGGDENLDFWDCLWKWLPAGPSGLVFFFGRFKISQSLCSSWSSSSSELSISSSEVTSGSPDCSAHLGHWQVNR